MHVVGRYTYTYLLAHNTSYITLIYACMWYYYSIIFILYRWNVICVDYVARLLKKTQTHTYIYWCNIWKLWLDIYMIRSCPPSRWNCEPHYTVWRHFHHDDIFIYSISTCAYTAAAGTTQQIISTSHISISNLALIVQIFLYMYMMATLQPLCFLLTP